MKRQPVCGIRPLHGLLLVAFLFALFMGIQTIYAQEEELRPVNLSVEPLETYTVGMPVTFVVRLSNLDGDRLTDEAIELHINGEVAHTVTTDVTGLAIIETGDSWLPDEYVFEVVYVGSETYERAIVSGVFLVRPITLTINTTPPLPDIRFAVAESVYATNEKGSTQIILEKAGRVEVDILLPPFDEKTSDTQIDFAQWGDGTHTATRELDLVADSLLAAGFTLSQRVSMSFFDAAEENINPDRITSVGLQSSSGDRLSFPDGRARWVAVNQIVTNAHQLTSSPIQYGIDQVMIDGIEIEPSADQNFFVTPDAQWEISVPLFYTRLRAEDAVLGFPAGNGIIITYPDRQTEIVPFDEEGVAAIGPLVGGEYTFEPVGVRGYVPQTTLTLTHQQDIALKVIALPTILLAGLIGFVGALSVILFVYRKWLWQLWKRFFGRWKPRPRPAPALATPYNQIDKDKTLTLILPLISRPLSIPRPSSAPRPKRQKKTPLLERVKQCWHLWGEPILATGMIFLLLVLVVALAWPRTRQFSARQEAPPQMEMGSAENEIMLDSMIISPTQSILTPTITTVFPTPDVIIVEPTRIVTVSAETPPTPIPTTTPVETIIHVVQAGEHLSQIALDYYGEADLWGVIFEANAEAIIAPDLLVAGTELIIPSLEE